jgi:hypothetical protein
LSSHCVCRCTLQPYVKESSHFIMAVTMILLLSWLIPFSSDRGRHWLWIQRGIRWIRRWIRSSNIFHCLTYTWRSTPPDMYTLNVPYCTISEPINSPSATLGWRRLADHCIVRIVIVEYHKRIVSLNKLWFRFHIQTTNINSKKETVHIPNKNNCINLVLFH